MMIEDARGNNMVRIVLRLQARFRLLEAGCFITVHKDFKLSLISLPILLSHEPIEGEADRSCLGQPVAGSYHLVPHPL